MSVKICIERVFEEAPVLQDFQAINKLRRGGILQKGYISGETLVHEKDNSVLVLSEWSSLDDWEAWRSSPARRSIEDTLTPRLTGPARIRTFVSCTSFINDVICVKVIIERKFKDSLLPEDFQVINRLRRSAIRQSGYLRGETLANFEQNTITVLSNWSFADEWEAWSSSRERSRIADELLPRLSEPPRIRVCSSIAN